MWDLIASSAHIIAPVISFAMFIPQAIGTWKVRKDPSKLEAISSGTQWLILLNATLWGIIAIDLNSFAVGAPGLVNAPLAMATLFLIGRSKLVNNPPEWLLRMKRKAYQASVLEASPRTATVDVVAIP